MNFIRRKNPHIYAIGDCIGGLQLAHAASHEGIIAVEHMNNLTPESLSYENIPSCIYTDPEVASIGLSEKEAKERGMEVKVGKFPFQAIGKAHVHGDTEGFVKIIANKTNDDIVGIHMVGPNVTEANFGGKFSKIIRRNAVGDIKNRPCPPYFGRNHRRSCHECQMEIKFTVSGKGGGNVCL